MTNIALKYLEGLESFFFFFFFYYYYYEKKILILKTKLRKIYHSKKKNNYGHTYVGNHLYCDRFTLPSLIPSFLKKILNIKGMNSPL